MKVVCVGQPKTGTKTMAEIFNLLGYKTNSNPLCLNITNDYILLDNNIKYYTHSIINDCDINIDLFDAFHDYPYSFNYEYIYKCYPDTKFILTIRNSEKWFNSFMTYQYIPGAVSHNVLLQLYNHKILSLENKEEIINQYNTYNNNIQQFFIDKPNSLLVISICDAINEENDLLYKISKFLDVNINFNLPHMNKQNNNGV